MSYGVIMDSIDNRGSDAVAIPKTSSRTPNGAAEHSHDVSARDGPPTQRRVREDWIDVVKGITISLVTLHHVISSLREAGLFPESYDRIYLLLVPVRMPLFFTVAGLFAASSLKKPLSEFIDSKIIHFMYFYVLWNIISYSMRMALSPFMDTAIDPWQILMIGWQPVVMLWFLYVLALAFVVLRLTKSWPREVVLALALFCHAISFNLPFDLEVPRNFLRFFIFFMIGAVFSSFIRAKAANARLVFAALCAAGYAALCMMLGQYREVLSFPVFGILAILSSATIVTLSSVYAQTVVGQLFRRIGVYSLYIYVMNFLATAVAAQFLRKIGLADYPLVIVTLGTPFAIGLCIIGYEVARRTPLRFTVERPKAIRIGSRQPVL